MPHDDLQRGNSADWWKSGRDSGADDDVEALAQELRSALRSGGPRVDPDAIHLYVAGDLAAQQSLNVRQHVVTWVDWNRAYWDAISALGGAQAMG